MIGNFSKIVCFFLATVALASPRESKATLTYETYLESWDSQWPSVMENLPATPSGTPTYLDTTLTIAFAAYLFNNPPLVQGTQFTNPNSDIGSIISFVHSHGGSVKLSYGGASYAPPAYPNYFISQTTANGGWPNNMQYLATGVINAIRNNYGTNENPLYLDGVDFDIEDAQPTTIYGQPYSKEQFAADLYAFLTLVRAGLPDKIITITIPGQGWGTYWELIAKSASTTNAVTQAPAPVDSVSFMEYDIYITPGFTYPQQINGDLYTYTSSPDERLSPNNTPGWGIPSNKVTLGLMPANDDLGNNLTVPGAKTLSAIAASTRFGPPLYAVMTWSLNRDALSDLNPNTPTNPTTLVPPPYQYSEEIRSTLQNPGRRYQKVKRKFRKNKAGPCPSQFVKQAVPPHGNPV